MNNNINLDRSITLPISNTTHNIIEDELVRTSSCAAIERTISQLPTNNIYLHPFDSNLKKLDVRRCYNLKYLPLLKDMDYINIGCCNNIKNQIILKNINMIEYCWCNKKNNIIENSNIEINIYLH